MQQRQSGCIEYAIHELVPLLPVSPTVTGIIQLDAQTRTHCRWIADQEINVLPVNLISVGLVLVRPNDIDHVAEVGADDRKSASDLVITSRFHEHQVRL